MQIFITAHEPKGNTHGLVNYGEKSVKENGSASASVCETNKGQLYAAGRYITFYRKNMRAIMNNIAVYAFE